MFKNKGITYLTPLRREMNNEFPKIVAVKPGEPFTPPEPLSDFAIQMIHAGLEIPSPESIRNMAREIRKWRGVPNPDLV